MQMVPLGSTKQSVIIRGEDRRHPVLLLVHGGAAETPLFRYYNSELEKNFVVVYWDQRGCGKSYTKRDANVPLNVQIFVQDLCDLAIYLKKYLAKRKSIYWHIRGGHFLAFLRCHSTQNFLMHMLVLGSFPVCQKARLHPTNLHYGQQKNKRMKKRYMNLLK
jgi:hypothetical protein